MNRGCAAATLPAVPLGLLNFLLFAQVGMVLPHLGPYLRGLGLTGAQLGLVEGLPWLVGPLAALAWARWSDRAAWTAAPLRWAARVVAVAALLLPFARSPLAIGAVLLLASLADRAIPPLLDAATLRAAGAGGPSYGAVRLFGSAGFAASAVGLGLLLEARGARPADVAVPVALAVTAVLFAAAASPLPRPEVAPAAGGPALREVRRLFAPGPFLVLLLACGIHIAASAPYHLLFGILVRDSGAPPSLSGLGMALAASSEIPAFAAYPWLERRTSPRFLLGLAFAGGAARWLILSAATGPAWLVGVQLLQGLSFGFFFAAAMSLLRALAPEAILATATTAFSIVVMNLSNAVAFYVTGLAYDAVGEIPPLFAWAAAVEVAAGAVLALLGPVRAR